MSEKVNAVPYKKPVLGQPQAWFFDMDDTLYNATSSMFSEIHVRMEEFIADAFQCSRQEAAYWQHHYWEKYGATFYGLQAHHGIKPEAFWHQTHDFDLKPHVITRFPTLEISRMIRGLPGKKILVTNGPAQYARGILRILKLTDAFDAVYSASDMMKLGRWRCKPDKTVYPLIAASEGVRPECSVVIEDSLQNLKNVRHLGMKTVWCVDYRRPKIRHLIKPVYVDVMIGNILELRRLWGKKLQPQPSKRAIRSTDPWCE